MKTAILTDLQALVTSNVLRAAISDDMTKLNPFDRTWPAFPAAVVMPPTVTSSEYEDTANNDREYTWYVMVVTTPENLPPSDPTYLEGLMDAVLNAFDQDCTLQGKADGAVLPAVLEPPGPVSSGDVTYIAFYITLKARALVSAGVKT